MHNIEYIPFERYCFSPAGIQIILPLVTMNKEAINLVADSRTMRQLVLGYMVPVARK